MSNQSHAEAHVLPLSVYLGIGGILIGLTVLTVYISYFDFGPFNLLVAMIVAAVKASFVALYFMHLKYDNKLYMLYFVSALFFLAVFIIITMFDTLRRDDIYQIKGEPIQKNAAMYDSLKADNQLEQGITDSLSVTSDTVEVTVDSTK